MERNEIILEVIQQIKHNLINKHGETENDVNDFIDSIMYIIERDPNEFLNVDEKVLVIYEKYKTRLEHL